MARRKVTPQRGWLTVSGEATYTDAGSAHTCFLETLLTHDELVDNDTLVMSEAKGDFFIKRLIIQGYARMSAWGDMTPGSAFTSLCRPAALALVVADFGSLESTNENPETEPIMSPEFDANCIRVFQRHTMEAAWCPAVGMVGPAVNNSTGTVTGGFDIPGKYGSPHFYLDMRLNANLYEQTGLYLAIGGFGHRGGGTGWVSSDAFVVNYTASILLQKRRGA